MKSVKKLPNAVQLKSPHASTSNMYLEMLNQQITCRCN